MSSVVGVLIKHPVSIFNTDGVAAIEVRVEVRTVGAALIRAALEVPVLIEDDLKFANKNIDQKRSLFFDSYIGINHSIIIFSKIVIFFLYLID